MNQETYYSLQEVADELKVAYLTVYRWVQLGKLKAHQVEKQYRVEKADLEAFMGARKKSNSPELQDLSRDELISMIKQLKRRKKYGIVWENKVEGIAEQCKKDLPVLEEVADRKISKAPEAPVNLLIEGDNYHSLAVLNYTHAGKVDLIYIDPPYNTGNRDFAYNDRYVDQEDTFRHSKWLSFMEKRLTLTKPLLKSTGAIFISIDDNEQAPLKMLCDEIFGKENFIATIIWQKKYTQSNDAKYFSSTHDFILCYAKRADRFKVRLLPRTEKQDARYKNPDNDPRGVWMTQPLHAKSGSDSLYSYTFANGVTWSPPAGTYPRFSKESLGKADEENAIWFGAKGTAVPRLKKYLNEMKQGVIPKTIWLYDEAGSNDDARRELKELAPENGFDSPKPTSLIMRIMALASDKNSIILDFFAGSGTTGHAVLKANRDDDGSRSFIICTNNEDNNGSGLKIATDICYPRIEKVIEGYNKTEGIPANLRYFKTSFVSKSKVSDDTRRALVQRSVEMICVRENTFEKLVGKPSYKIYRDTDHVTGILFDLASVDAFKKALQGYELPAHIYVFSLSNDTYDEDFADLGLDHALCPIPESILEVYRKLFRSKNATNS